MTGLPITGTLRYNGYKFDGASHIDVRTEFVYDDADRSIVGHKYTIRVRAIVTEPDGESTDSDLLNIRRRLGVAGARMEFTDKGFGDDLRIQGGGAGPLGRINDIMTGPKPRFLSWTPIGNDKAAEIDWVVELVVSVCPPGTKGRPAGVMALNYGVRFDIDDTGNTTRTISGYLQIAQKGGYNVVQDSADRYREKFQVPVLAGFKRSQTWDVSLDKSRVNFSIVDTEVDSVNAFPRGLTDVSATHSFYFARSGAGERAAHRTRVNTISMEATVMPGFTGQHAWITFIQLVRQRVVQSRRRRMNPFLTNLSVNENIFGRTHSFSVTYQMLNTIRDFMADTGLFMPLGTDWTRWNASILNVAHGPRGTAQLRDIPQNDAVITLCTSTDYTAINNKQFVGEGGGGGGGGGGYLRRSPSGYDELENAYPDKEKSFLDFEVSAHLLGSDYTVSQPILQPPGATEGQVWPAESDKVQATEFQTEPAPRNKEASVIQRTGTTDWRIRLVGRGIRAGYPVPRAKLERVGDRIAYPVRQEFLQRQEYVAFGVPVYNAAWAVDYVLERSPGRVDVPPNVADPIMPSAGTV